MSCVSVTCLQGQDLPRLRCPRCRVDLTGERLRCPTCEDSYLGQVGIPTFLASDSYWQITARSDIEAFLQEQSERGLEAAVASLPEKLTAYWFDSRRADFRTILPSRHHRSVLDAGSGAGAVAVELASSSDHVWAVDTCEASLRLLEARVRALDLNNIRVAHATVLDLPFDDGVFDLAVLNGVLERVAYEASCAAVMHEQRRALAEVSRCLSPGGTLYVGIENRFGINYLLGSPDEHTGLRYGNVLPRYLANKYSRRVRGRDFTTFTHSYGALQRLLAEAGLHDVRIWSPLPTYREIRVLESLSDFPPNLVEAVDRVHPGRIPRIMVRLSRAVPRWVWRYLSPHFAIVARKPVAQQ